MIDSSDIQRQGPCVKSWVQCSECKEIQFYSLSFGQMALGGGSTPLQEANRDVPLDGVAFSLYQITLKKAFCPSRFIFVLQHVCNFNTPKNFTCLHRKFRKEFVGQIAKFTSPGGALNTTSFAHWCCNFLTRTGSFVFCHCKKLETWATASTVTSILMTVLCGHVQCHLRDGPLENLWGGGAGEVQKKYSRKGKLNEKNSCMPINPQKYSCYGPKKTPAARKFPSLPQYLF